LRGRIADERGATTQPKGEEKERRDIFSEKTPRRER